MDMRRNILPGNGRFRIPEQFLLISLCISCVLSLYFYCHYLLVFFIIKEIVNSVTKSINHYLNRMLVNSPGKGGAPSFPIVIFQGGDKDEARCK